MDKIGVDLLKDRLTKEGYQRLQAIDNKNLHVFIAKYIELCNPSKVFVSSDTKEDLQYIKDNAIKNGEERQLSISTHTAHFDGFYDQARDKENTKFLLSKGVQLDSHINAIDKEQGLKEIHSIMQNIMEGREMYVMFFCLGPTGSEFSIPCVQITDSAYVVHSESLLYRKGYEEFKRQGKKAQFFKLIHSAGELDNRKVSKNIDKRRVYIDAENSIVYSANTQYGGNTIGLKKLSMRLAIYRSSDQGWLTEHMFLMGVHGPNKRKTYFSGAFPSLCGKTSTSMVEGETIVGDDIAYLRRKNGRVYAVNVESGMFGIIMGINSKDDPIIWEVLDSKEEIIVSNILIGENNKPYWIGMDTEIPERGENYSGEWTKGKKDSKGTEITPSHRNARFTISLNSLKNVDPQLDDPKGVELGGVIYGGRDSDTWVPVQEAFDWTHGIITKGVSLESETTAATLGKEGVRKFNLMSNLDFVSVPLTTYIQNNLDFINNVDKEPLVFGVNYFLKDKDGNFLNERADKKVWLKWMEQRVHDELEAHTTPTGYIPKYEDLKKLFKHVLNKEYTKDDYIKQFTLRIPENFAKIDRILVIYKAKVNNPPDILFEILEEERKRLESAQKIHGDYISPFDWKE